MNPQPKQTISKTETVIKLSNGNGLLAHIDIADEVVTFSNYHVKFKVDELSFDDINHLSLVIDNIPERCQHSYSEQEVRGILEAQRQRYYDIAESYEMNPFEKHKCIDKKSFLIVYFDDLLIKK